MYDDKKCYECQEKNEKNFFKIFNNTLKSVRMFEMIHKKYY